MENNICNIERTGIIKTTVVTNLLTQEKLTFVNDSALPENIVSAIILNNRQSGRLLIDGVRAGVKSDYAVLSSISTITGLPFAFSYKANLIARHL